MATPEEKTILVVDDEPDIVVFLQTLLEDAGFQVMTASDGEEALEKIQAHPPDLISLDLVMPRKSGIKLFYELRKHKEWCKIPILIVTGQAREEAVRKDLEHMFSERMLSGPRTYLEKPVKPEDYVNLIKRELGIETAERAPAPVPDKDQLQRELRQLSETADLEALQEALRVLKAKKG